MSDFKTKMHPNSISTGTHTPDPTEGAYSDPPDLLTVFRQSLTD